MRLKTMEDAVNRTADTPLKRPRLEIENRAVFSSKDEHLDTGVYDAIDDVYEDPDAIIEAMHPHDKHNSKKSTIPVLTNIVCSMTHSF